MNEKEIEKIKRNLNAYKILILGIKSKLEIKLEFIKNIDECIEILDNEKNITKLIITKTCEWKLNERLSNSNILRYKTECNKIHEIIYSCSLDICPYCGNKIKII